MVIFMHLKLGMKAIAVKFLLCMLVLIWRIPSWVRGTGGAMGPVVSLLDPTYGNLTTVCALQSRTLLPVCVGTIPAGMPKMQPMWALTAGNNFICGLKYDSHTPICWGSDVNVTSIPTAYASTSYSLINAGSNHVCGLRDNSTPSPGIVDCWGSTSYGQSLPPRDVPMLSVTSGLYYTCGIILATKKVVCWGKLNTTSMPGPPGNGQFKAIFSSTVSMCAIRLDGNTECWWALSSAFANPHPNSLFTSIAGTYYYTCAVEQPNHQMICWSPINIYPTPMPYAISALSASAYDPEQSNDTMENKNGYICAVREDIEVGNLYCFGTLLHSLGNSLSLFSASKGICRDQCPEGQYPVLTNGQCPNPDHKVCLDCQGACPSDPPLPSVPPPTNISTNTPPSTSDTISSSSSTIPVSSPSAILKVVVPISIAVGCVIFVVGVLAFLIVHDRLNICCQVCLNRSSGLIIFTRSQLLIATNNYDTIIGKGGFGRVYRGVLRGNQIVAIKKPHTPGTGGAYTVEFTMLSRLNYPSLVKLIGYCKKNNALVFPYMENGSLQDRLEDPMAGSPLSNMRLRLKIAMQVANGLHYIHESGVIHRDMKSANILLDGSWNAYIADFGVSRFSPDGDNTHCTTQVIGTPSYLDPDYKITRELTYKSDVYSFGVVLLELASGLTHLGLADNARFCHERGRLSELVDRNLLNNIYRDSCLTILKIAIMCVEPSRDERPTMQNVLQQIEMLGRIL